MTQEDKNYPDIKILVLMSEVFQVSLDNLIKGDLDRIKKEIDTQEYESFQKDSIIFTRLFIALLIASTSVMYFAIRIEKYKKKYDYITVISFFPCL